MVPRNLTGRRIGADEFVEWLRAHRENASLAEISTALARVETYKDRESRREQLGFEAVSPEQRATNLGSVLTGMGM